MWLRRARVRVPSVTLNDKHVLQKAASLLPSMPDQAQNTKSEQTVLGSSVSIHVFTGVPFRF